MGAGRCRALEDCAREGDYYRGYVQLSGGRWNAVSDEPIVNGQWLRVQSLEGLTVTVIPDDTGPGRKEAL